MAQRDAAGGLTQQHSMLLGFPPANKQPKSEKKNTAGVSEFSCCSGHQYEESQRTLSHLLVRSLELLDLAEGRKYPQIWRARTVNRRLDTQDSDYNH